MYIYICSIDLNEKPLWNGVVVANDITDARVIISKSIFFDYELMGDTIKKLVVKTWPTGIPSMGERSMYTMSEYPDVLRCH